MRAGKLWAGAAVAAAALSSFTRADEIAAYNATGGVMPTDVCWSYLTAGGVAAPSHNGVAAVLGPTTTSGYHYWERDLPQFSTVDGAKITASVRVDASTYYFDGSYKRTGYYLQVNDKNGVGAQLGIASDRVLLAIGDVNPADQTFGFNSTNGFHTYGLELVGTTATVRIDGNVVLTDTVGVGGPTQPRARFGDMSVLGSSTTQTAWVTVEAVPDCVGSDFNCDGLVDGADLGQLLGAWGTDSCIFDLNADGLVDGADLGILLGNWG